MQSLPRLLSHLSRARLPSAIPYIRVATKFLSSPFPTSRVNARLMSSEANPIAYHHVTRQINQVVYNRSAAPLTPQERWAVRSRRALEDSIANPPADAYAGRSVKNTGNLALTFKTLNEILTRNKVKQQVRMSERHEKKGAKRRRLQSERWRKQFSNEVRKKVQLVIKIRDRGA